MHSPRRLALPVALLAAAALSACSGSPGSGAPGGPPDPSASPTETALPLGGGASVGDCVLGRWTLDRDDAAVQLYAVMIAGGAPLTDARAEGQVTLEIADDGMMSYHSNIRYTLTMSSEAASGTITQTQIGDAAGHWAWVDADRGSMAFTGWSNGVQITSVLEINGQHLESPFEFPDQTIGTTPMAITCTDQYLTTQPEGSPFELAWRR